MPIEADDYWSATKHPWACVLFVLPLLAAYEIGLQTIASNAPRNGADVWLRAVLGWIGISAIYGAPCLLVVVLLAWGLVRRDGRPSDKVGVWVGMIGESAAYAVLLLGLCQGFWHVLLRADAVLGQPSQRIAATHPEGEAPAEPSANTARREPRPPESRVVASTNVVAAEPEPVWGQIVSYLGAGIYEETLFRLLLFAGLVRLFSWSETCSSIVATSLAAAASALVFAAAHHLGPTGEPFNLYVFSFRAFAGVYFAWLYQLRGFGIAVGAHAGYDVLVGLILK